MINNIWKHMIEKPGSLLDKMLKLEQKVCFALVDQTLEL